MKGLNGNSIFLPAAGFFADTTLLSAGIHGGYWSRSPNGSYNASCLAFRSVGPDWTVSYRRFNSYNAATKVAVLQAVGEKMERVKIGEAGRYIEPPGHWELVEVRPGVWMLVWVDGPIDPRARPGKDFRFKNYIHRVDRIAVQRVNEEQQILHLRGKDGLHITLNVFGLAEKAVLQR